MASLCSCQVPAAEPPTTGEPQQVGARLVTLLPLTGSLAGNGPSRERAAMLAAMQVNEAGGLRNGRLQLDHLDSGTQSEVAATRLENYLNTQGKPDVLIGASSSQVSREILQWATRENFPMISPASTASSFTRDDDADLFFRTAPSDAFQGTVLADRIQESGVRKLGLIYQNDAYGNSLKDTLESALSSKEVAVVTSLPYAQGDAEALLAQLDAFFAQDIDGVCLVGYPQEAPQIFNHWIDAGAKPDIRWFFSDGLKSAQTMAGVREPFRLDRSLGTVPSSLPQEASARFEQDYLAQYQALPVSFAAHTYDAVVLAALALQKQQFDPSLSIGDALREVSSPPGQLVGPGVKGLKDALERVARGEDVNYEGASGNVDFDAQGDVLSDYEIWTFRSGFIFRVETRSPQR